jgi:hypothetical protein
LTFSTDDQGRQRPFRWTGSGVTDTSLRYDVDWQPNVWYRIRGIVIEPEATAIAKIWRAGMPKPTRYQASATVTTGITTPLPYHAVVAGDPGGQQATLEIAHACWEVERFPFS